MKTEAAPGSLQVLFGAGGAAHVSILGAIEAFLRVELIGRSPETVTWYRKRLLMLSDYLGPGRPLADLLEVDLLTWYEELDRRETRYTGAGRPAVAGGLSPETKHGYVRAVKRLFKWLARKGVLAADISADLRLPKLPYRRGRKGAAEADAERMIEAARGNARDYALLRFVEATGCRRGGAAHLLLGDLDLDNPDPRLRLRVSVREKGDKERVVLLTREALDALVAWLVVRPDVSDPHVFVGQRPGRPWKPLSEDGVSAVYERYKERLGITGRVSPHQWRHRWFRRLIHKGMGLKRVSQLGGHSSVTVTDMFYSDLDMDELQDAFEAATGDSDHR